MVRFEEDGGEQLAPVTPLFGARIPAGPAGDARASAPAAAPADTARIAHTRTTAREAGASADIEGDGRDAGERGADERDAAETALLRRLRTRQLSVAEALALLVERGLPGEQCDDVLDDCLRRGYLDDARLAEQLIHAAVTRKGQGRRMIAQALSKRLIARDVIDATIAELPDDDDERALEFARTKARALVRYDDDVALRRLLGALARRGFGGSSAGAAARTALAEARAEAPPTGVRFR